MPRRVAAASAQGGQFVRRLVGCSRESLNARLCIYDMPEPATADPCGKDLVKSWLLHTEIRHHKGKETGLVDQWPSVICLRVPCLSTVGVDLGANASTFVGKVQPE